MEKIKTKTAIYPGCSLDGTASSYKISLEKVLAALGVDYCTMENWNCCGASSAHAIDYTLYLSLSLRNLELAERQGYYDILAPCAACYHRLTSVNFKLKNDAELLESINEKADLNYCGNVRVFNILDFFANVVGTERIAERVTRPLDGLKTVCYYGCLNTRIPRMESFDIVENPTSMDRIIQALGAETPDWSYRAECCGGSLFVTSESTSKKLVSKILKYAEARGADCIAVACPMCHNNLDTLQDDIRAQYGISSPMPVLFVTQLMGLAFGISESELKLDHPFVPFALPETCK